MPQPSCPSVPVQISTRGCKRNWEPYSIPWLRKATSLLFPLLLNILAQNGVPCRLRQKPTNFNVEIKNIGSVQTCAEVFWSRVMVDEKNVNVKSQCHSHDSAWYWEVRSISQPLRLIHPRVGNGARNLRSRLRGALLHTSFSKHLSKGNSETALPRCH